MTKPNNTVRLCIDPSKLNDQIINNHNSRLLEDILHKLSKARYFSVFDVKSCYWYLELDLKSSYPTIFSCMYEKFRLLRLPFRLPSSSNIFQCKIDQLFHHLKTASGIADDMITWGNEEDSSDHDKCAEQIL